MKFDSPKVLFLRPAAFLFLMGAVSLACGSVSQSDDGGNGGAAGGGTAGGVGAGPPHGPNDGGASAGKSGSAGSAGTAGGAGTAGTYGGSDGGAGSGAAGKDGGGLCLCDAIYSPVCGVDGKDYASACNAACAGVAVAHAGGCAAGGTDGSVPLDYCDQASDCTTRPAGGCSCSQICVAKTDPVPASPPFTCTFACPLIVVACGCVNHQCTAGAATATP
ncbi:MAG TPA: Kazal-type serine protease inhibitor [Polyangia bacterium]|jgi:hypothetical protein|nr:Kazal-type serine protease inhibitor [Polyangia bacterium]